MLIPLRHENMEGRRWPVVTFALIALNILVFLCTHWKMEEQAPERAEVRMHVIILAGIHPELKKTENVQEFVNEIQNKVPEQFWKQLSSPNRKIEDSWDARIRLMEDPELLQAEMDGLAARFTDEEKSSILGNYAFVPAHPRPITYLTSMFLHTGWLHLIGNMWFLWLAGFILEDKWGRVIYPVFYLLAGAAASQFHAWFYPGSIVPARAPRRGLPQRATIAPGASLRRPPLPEEAQSPIGRVGILQGRRSFERAAPRLGIEYPGRHAGCGKGA